MTAKQPVQVHVFVPPGCHCCLVCTQDADHSDSSQRAVCYVQAKATAAERRVADMESEMLLLSRSLRDAEAAVMEWQVGTKQAPAIAMHCILLQWQALPVV